MAARKASKEEWFVIVSGLSGLVIDTGAFYGTLGLAPSTRPTPPRQRWREVDGALVSGTGQTLVMDGDYPRTEKKPTVKPVVRQKDALRSGSRGPFLIEGETGLHGERASKPSTTWRFEPLATSRFEPTDDEEQLARRELYTQAVDGDEEAQRSFAAQLASVKLKAVRVRAGAMECTLDQLLDRMSADMTLDLVKPFAAPLFWDVRRARLLIADSAERVVNVFDHSSYGSGQGARAIAAGRGLVAGQSDKHDVERARKAASAVEPWDDVKLALGVCVDCLAADSELNPSWSLRNVVDVRRYNPRSLGDKLKSAQAVAQERAWQVERLWGYLSGALPCPTADEGKRRLLAARRSLARVQELRKQLDAFEKPLRADLAKAEAARDKATARVLRDALKLL